MDDRQDDELGGNSMTAGTETAPGTETAVTTQVYRVFSEVKSLLESGESLNEGKH